MIGHHKQKEKNSRNVSNKITTCVLPTKLETSILLQLIHSFYYRIDLRRIFVTHYEIQINIFNFILKFSMVVLLFMFYCVSFMFINALRSGLFFIVPIFTPKRGPTTSLSVCMSHLFVSQTVTYMGFIFFYRKVWSVGL